ncbi:hypothetical protein LOZ39_006235 [Ophidiomyces ophidiicola]|uniref:Uncharacterized protein n=1 Tax=Ophidiomyces ophidiicola TaxID=1387563 RepID=A0ACB8UNE7_9EURO|nr:hypothetical protein LOZ64_006221 [Ophidiomyces ophidiicola]KAI1917498.1 hypothetical protein LOZ61_000562 [Ophidiomyces ophidiicola]KAI1920095.1 hypothetical protein LOZ60_006686 [Ophidiomyces ophidiicola]KAI2002680.1 hypothetical protein LOZ50_004848 [Ophidiomyces ophidiicola]KAI2004982.1 hypothetical protein LOZ49_005635 [Ophidiomyces ophidiicola]
MDFSVPPQIYYPFPEHSRAHLLNLPLELRHQIILYVLIASAHDFPLPYEYGIPRKRPLLCVFSPSILASLQECHQHPTPGLFWGSERMTQLMRVNKLLYDEVFEILYTQCSLYTGLSHLGLDEALLQMEKRNATAVQQIRHFHWRFAVMLSSTRLSEESIRNADTDLKTQARHMITGLPSLRSVTVQIYFIGYSIAPPPLRVLAVEDIMSVLHALKSKEIDLFGECNRADQREVIEECQKRLANKIK